MARKRKNAKVTMREGLLAAFKDNIIQKLKNRHMLLCPFPLDPMVLYRSLWSNAQWEGLMALEQVDNLLTRRSQMHLRIPLLPGVVEQSNVVHIFVNLDKEYPMGGGDYDEIDYTKLSDEEKVMVRSWIVDWQKFQSDTDKVEAALNEVVKACSTIGQVVRIWPDLIGFMRPSQQEEVSSKAVRSPYPRKVLEYYKDDNGMQKLCLEPDFQPERFAALHDLIAEALMLPEYDDLRHIGYHGWTPRE